MNSKSWTGTAAWREEGGPFPIRKPDGPAVLVIDDEGACCGPALPSPRL